MAPAMSRIEDFNRERISVACSIRPVSLDDRHRTLTFTITNNSKFDLDGSLSIMVDFDSYYERKAAPIGSVPAYGKKTVSVTVDKAGGVSIDDLRNNIKYRLEMDVGTTTATLHGSFSEDSMWFFKDGKHNWTKKFGPEGCNILIFGIVGGSKSSFIQTIMTTLQDEMNAPIITNAIRVGGSGKHQTVDLRCHEVVKNIKLWDTWGLTGKNYGDAELRAIVQGYLPSGWSMGLKVGEYIQVINSKKDDRAFRAAQVVVVMVPHASLNDEDQMANLKIQITHIQELNINPIIMLTLVDEKWLQLRANAMDPPKELEGLMRQAGDKLGVPAMNVTYTVNYFEEKTRNFDIERLAYKNLDKLIHAAQDFVEKSSYKPTAISRLTQAFDWIVGNGGGGATTDTNTTTTIPTTGKGLEGGGAVCRVCWEDKADRLVLPCNHLCLCQECLVQVQGQSNKCPMCTQDIQNTTRVFF